MSDNQQLLYYIVVFFSMFYVFFRTGITKDSILIVLVFWAGFFQYLDQVAELPIGIENTYKIALVLYSFYLASGRIFRIVVKDERLVNVAFVLFSLSFWISFLLFGGNIFTILSQYLYKYGFVFILFHYFKTIIINKTKAEYVKRIIINVLFVQVFLSVLKLLLIGAQGTIVYEPIVGSISAGGAGSAVVIPIVGLIFFWVIKDGSFNRREWAIAISLILIAVASAKRQPVFFFPIVLYALFSYVKKGFVVRHAFVYIPLVFLLLYSGIRLNPSLNPENKVWGAFDISYVSGYIAKYYFGTDDFDYLLSDQYTFDTGRGSGFVFFFRPEMLNLNDTKEIFFGRGRYEVATAAHGRFHDASHSGYGLQLSGLIGEAAALLFSLGYAGTSLMIILALSIIRACPNKRISLILILYYFWDFVFYYNQVVYSNTSALIVLFIVFYSKKVGH